MKNEKILNAVGRISDELIADAAITAGRKTRTAVWVRWTAIAACLCLIAAAIIIPKLTQSNNKNILLVNEIDWIPNVDMDVRYTRYPNPSDAECGDVLKQFATAIGLNYNDFAAKIPDAFKNKSFYSVDVPVDAARTEYIPHDYVFEYQTENGREVTIAICSKSKPLRDIVFMCNPTPSIINGVSIVIFRYNDNFLVRFSWETVNYDIETNGITLEELEHLLVGILS